MSLKAKIEAVIYASEEPVTLAQLVGLLAVEAEGELSALDARQAELPLGAQPSLVAQPSSPTEEPMEAERVPGAPEFAAMEDDSAAAVATQGDGEAQAVEGGSAESVPELNTGPATDAAATDPREARERERRVRDHLRRTVDTLMREYAESDRGIEIREVAGGFRMGTKPEYHDAVRGFVRSLKPALKLTLQALETLAVVAYKQPVTAAEISEIRGVDSAGVLGGLIGRKLIATAGRKQVIGRPMLYKTTKEFLVRFGLRDVQELPSMEEFERLAGELNEQEDLPMEPTEALIERANARGDADHIREVTAAEESTDGSVESNDEEETAQAQSRAAEPGGTADEQDTSTERSTDNGQISEEDSTRS